MNAKPKTRTICAAAALVSLTVLCLHTGRAQAQTPGASPSGPAEPAPPQPGNPQEAPTQGYDPQQQQQPYGNYPPGYAPPPGYAQPQGYPAPGYGNAPGYGQQPGYSGAAPYGSRPNYYPPPPPPPMPRATTDRPFMLGGSLGLGVLHYDQDIGMSTSAAAAGYSVRLGFGVAPRLMLLLSIDGASTGDEYTVFNQTVYTAGLQMFLTRQLFVRGGVGMGNITQRDSDGNYLVFGAAGLGVTASLGVELLQGYNWSLELAGQLIAGFYSNNEQWSSGAVNIGFNFF